MEKVRKEYQGLFFLDLVMINMKKIKIGDFNIGKEFPPFIVAEAGINHNGEVEKALEMIKVAKNSGADAIKFQTFKAEEFISDESLLFTYKSQGKTVTESQMTLFKRCELDRNNFLEINQEDLEKELIKLASNINLDLETLKNVCESNGLDFALIEDQIKIELFWNSLIFELYKSRLKVNSNEIEERLKLIQDKKKIDEYLISEIVIKPIEKHNLKSEIEKLKNKIKIEGFENIARNLSISESSKNGGDLGWVNENIISEKIKFKLASTAVGALTEPIVLPEGILILKVRDKRKIENTLSLEDTKNQLVKSEKLKILKMHSLSHYDKLRRSISINFFNE